MTTNTNAAAWTDKQYLEYMACYFQNSLVPEIRGHHERLMKIAASLTTAAAVPAAGWVMVPVEPTEEMIDAGRQKLGALYGHEGAKRCWHAQLAAAPKAEPVPAAPRTALWSDAQEIYDEMTARMPSWDGRGSSRVGAVALALTVVADRAMRAQAAPQPAVQQGDASPTMPRDIEMMATNRYRPVPSGVLAYKVVGGDGNRSLFSGTKGECQIVARKLTEAFLDGAHVALTAHPAAPVAQGDARAEEALLKVLSAVQRYLPPDGPSAKDTLTEIIGIVDPWPLDGPKGNV